MGQLETRSKSKIKSIRSDPATHRLSRPAIVVVLQNSQPPPFCLRMRANSRSVLRPTSFFWQLFFGAGGMSSTRRPPRPPVSNTLDSPHALAQRLQAAAGRRGRQRSFPLRAGEALVDCWGGENIAPPRQVSFRAAVADGSGAVADALRRKRRRLRGGTPSRPDDCGRLRAPRPGKGEAGPSTLQLVARAEVLQALANRANVAVAAVVAGTRSKTAATGEHAVRLEAVLAASAAAMEAVTEAKEAADAAIAAAAVSSAAAKVSASGAATAPADTSVPAVAVESAIEVAAAVVAVVPTTRRAARSRLQRFRAGVRSCLRRHHRSEGRGAGSE